jgi:tetratricopeptide (TPR) repeat protein
MSRLVTGLALFLIVLSPIAARSAGPTDDAASHYDKAVEHNKMRRLQKARDELIRAVNLDLENNKYHQALFINYISTREGPKGIKFYEDLIREHPKSPASHYWLGRLFLDRQALDKAAAEFIEASRLAPKDDHAYVALGHTYWRMGEDEKALKAYREADRLSPDIGPVHGGMGNVFFHRKEYEKAEREYLKAIELGSDTTEFRYNLGVIYEKTRRIGKAIEQWKKILDDDPNEIQAREHLARVYFRGEQYKSAAEEYSMLSRLQPLEADVFLSLGESLILWASKTEDPGDVAKIRNSAVHAFQQTLEIDPDNKKAKAYLEKLHAPESSPLH